MAGPAVDLLRQGGLLDPLWIAILWAAVAYLILLGMVCLVSPPLAARFLGGFAQSTAVNLAEAGARFAVGLALIGASPLLHARQLVPARMLALYAAPIGLFLCGSALAIALFPRLHRAYARHVVPAVLRRVRLFGVSTLLVGATLGATLPLPE